jgi:hypothetical protein
MEMLRFRKTALQASKEDGHATASLSASQAQGLVMTDRVIRERLKDLLVMILHCQNGWDATLRGWVEITWHDYVQRRWRPSLF